MAGAIKRGTPTSWTTAADLWSFPPRQDRLNVAIAGNQPHDTAAQLDALGVTADFIASSAEWKVSKPSPGFFDQLIGVAQDAPYEILYVGDRVDNDIVPAHRAGLRTALLRGPWGYLHSARLDANVADLQLHSLAELTALLPNSQ